jgi:protein dithiol oxidoreductase (disulfide-forming)
MKKKYLAIVAVISLSLVGFLFQNEISDLINGKKTPTSEHSEIQIVEPDAILESSDKYIENVDFKIVKNIHVDDSISKPYIVEYFWMGCSHCQNLEPHINKYSADNDVTLIKKAAPIKERWILDAKVYYALLETGNKNHFHDLFSLYTKLGEQGKLPMQKDIVEFLKSKNINVEDFENSMMSNSVSNTLKQNNSEMITNGLSGVPKLVINGKYLAIPTEKIKTQEDYMDLVTYLINKDN